jgi:Tol biopolymer transport system component
MIAPVTGKAAFYRRTDSETRQLVVMDSDGGSQIALEQSGRADSAVWSPDGRALVYLWEGTAGNGLERMVKVWRDGEASPRILATGRSSYDLFAWSPDCRHVAARKPIPEESRAVIAVFDIPGSRENVVGLNHHDSGNWQSVAAWSPNGREICFTSREKKEDVPGLWMCDTDGKGLKRLTPEDCSVYYSDVSFSPDGEWIAFSAHYQRLEQDSWTRDIWVVRPSGRDLHRVTNGSSQDWQHRHNYSHPRWTPDGRYLIARHHFPDPQRRENGHAKGWCYINARSGEVIDALGDDVLSNRRETGLPCWELSSDGTKFFCHTMESEVANLGGTNEAKGKTWYVAAVFDFRSRARKELLRLEAEPSALFDWGLGFSPDGSRIYLNVPPHYLGASREGESDVGIVRIGE